MMILLGNINPDTIHVISRWESDKIIHYIHAIAQPLMQGNSTTMVSMGDYIIIPVDTRISSRFCICWPTGTDTVGS